MGQLLGTVFSKLLGSSTLFQSECKNISCCSTAAANARVYDPSKDAAAVAAAAALGAADLRGLDVLRRQRARPSRPVVRYMEKSDDHDLDR